ncbi:hypothetical protein D3C75_1213530 [compost metagenome]
MTRDGAHVFHMVPAAVALGGSRLGHVQPQIIALGRNGTFRCCVSHHHLGLGGEQHEAQLIGQSIQALCQLGLGEQGQLGLQ